MRARQSAHRHLRRRLPEQALKIGGNRRGHSCAMQYVRVETATRRDTSFDDVYEREYDGLVRLAYVTTGNIGAAEDVVQDVFAAWYRNGEHVQYPAAYLRKAVVSRCISWVRRRILERRHATSAPPSPHDPVDADIAAVRAALRRLGPRQRAAVFLRYYVDLPVAQIAEVLGCRVGTVKSMLSRSLATMKEYLGE